MDIRVPVSLLAKHLKTNAPLESLIDALSLCGPTVDRTTTFKNDTVLEIEAITNRVDSASVFGIAREAVAILPEFGHEAELISMPKFDASLFDSDQLQLEVQIMDQSLIPRFAAVIMDNITVEKSNQETISWLNSADVRDLNNVVDVTNELTLRYGQPCHVFDYDKIIGHKMVIRESKKGEKITTLDDKDHILPGKDIVIEDGSGRLIDLCGIMGGKHSCVDDNTKRIVLFVQNYEPKHIRRTSLLTQERTLAAQIFEKSPDIEMVDKVLCEGVKMLEDRAGGTVASKYIEIYPAPQKDKHLTLDLQSVTDVAGTDIGFEHMRGILSRLGFSIHDVAGQIDVGIPSYRRNDINIKEDLIEEILRVYGYFRLSSDLPSTQLANNQPDKLLTDELRIKKLLSALGYTEVFNYSLTNKKIFEKANIPLNEYVSVTNPLSEDFEIMRPSLVPQMLQVLSDNKGKIESYNFFELSNTYQNYAQGSLPKEISTLCIATNKNFFEVKGLLEAMSDKVGWDLDYREEKGGDLYKQKLQIIVGGKLCGTLGIVGSSVLKNFDLDFEVTVIDLDFELLSAASQSKRIYRPVPNQTPMYLDITIDTQRAVGVLMRDIQSFDLKIYDLAYLDNFGNKKTFRVYFYENGPVDAKDAEELAQRMIKELV